MVAQNSQGWCSSKKSAFSHQPCLAPRSALSEASEAHGKTEGKSASLPFGRCGVPRHASARDAARCGCRALREVVGTSTQCGSMAVLAFNVTKGAGPA